MAVPLLYPGAAPTANFRNVYMLCRVILKAIYLIHPHESRERHHFSSFRLPKLENIFPATPGISGELDHYHILPVKLDKTGFIVAPRPALRVLAWH